MMNLKMQSPWITFYDKVRELFKGDPEVKTVWNDETNGIELYVDNSVKAEALGRMMPDKKKFGNVIMTITIIPSNKCDVTGKIGNLAEAALTGNPLFHYTKTFPEIFTNKITYVVMAKEVIQYYNDDLSDLFGNANCLPEDLARDVFTEAQGYFFSTDIM